MKRTGWILLMIAAVACMSACRLDRNVITVITREDGSGTRAAFAAALGIEDITLTAEVSQSTTVVMTSVRQNDHAIGYISLGSLDDSVKALKIDGVAPTAENIKSGKYKISRAFHLVTRGELDPLTRDLIDFILSDEGQAVVEENGYVAVAGGRAYRASDSTGRIVITGSSSVKPVMEKLKEAYLAQNPRAVIDLSQSDSGNGMMSVANGSAQIGLSSRELRPNEVKKGLRDTVIAMDGIAVIVNRRVELESIASEALAGIYRGEITSWRDMEE